MTQALHITEGWPALMTTETAARYLSVSDELLHQLAERHTVRSVLIASDDTRWRKQDLDRLIRKLPLTEVASPRRTVQIIRLEDQQIETIASAVAARLASDSCMSEKRLVSIREAGKMLGIGRSTVYRMMEDGRLVTTRIGRRTLVHVNLINAFVG